MTTRRNFFAAATAVLTSLATVTARAGQRAGGSIVTYEADEVWKLPDGTSATVHVVHARATWLEAMFIVERPNKRRVIFPGFGVKDGQVVGEEDRWEQHSTDEAVLRNLMAANRDATKDTGFDDIAGGSPKPLYHLYVKVQGPGSTSHHLGAHFDKGMHSDWFLWFTPTKHVAT